MKSEIITMLTLFAIGLGGCGSGVEPSQQENASQSASFALASQTASTESAASSQVGEAAALRLSAPIALDPATENLGPPPEGASIESCCFGRCSNSGTRWTDWKNLGHPVYGHCTDRVIGHCSSYNYYQAKWDGC